MNHEHKCVLTVLYRRWLQMGCLCLVAPICVPLLCQSEALSALAAEITLYASGEYCGPTPSYRIWHVERSLTKKKEERERTTYKMILNLEN